MNVGYIWNLQQKQNYSLSLTKAKKSQKLKNKKKQRMLKLLQIPSIYIKLQTINLGYHSATNGLARSKKLRKYFERKGFYRKIYAKNGV